MNSTTLGFISKIIGAKYESAKTFEEDVALQNLTPELDAIRQFLIASSRTEMLSFLNKLKKLVTQFVLSFDAYSSFDHLECIAKKEEIFLNLQPERLKMMPEASSPTERRAFFKKSFERKEDCDAHYLSIDMMSANFAALKLILGTSPKESWPAFLKQIVPSDERGNSNHNKKLGIVGQITFGYRVR